MVTYRRIPLIIPAFVLGLASLASGQTVEIEGCLTPGSRPGYFVLTDEITGDPVTVTGPGLSQHAGNHLERLTGSYDDDGRILLVNQVEHVADTCQPLYQRFTDRVGRLVDDLRRKAAFGLRAGVGIEPEMILLGAHAEFATGVENLIFRPNIEFGLGEVTAEYAANAEAIYRVPFTRMSNGRLEVWDLYVGGGPSITVFNQEFRERDFNTVTDRPRDNLFTLDDRDTEIGFNVVVGLARENGFFGEVKAGAYGNPAVRLILGYTF